MAQDPITTITLNPALDFSTAVPDLHPNEKLRCEHASMFPGGGGVNVARAMWNLGTLAKACVALGGPNGQALELLLRAEGVDVVPVKVDVHTRHSLSVKEHASQNTYRFMLPGTQWTQIIEADFLAHVTPVIAKSRWCVLSGSMPPGTDVSTIRRLHAICRNAQCKLVVDTSGPTLRELAQNSAIGVDILRANEVEAQESSNATLETPADFAAAAGRMIERGAAKAIVMGLGGDGNLVVTADGNRLWCPAPKVKMVSRVGAGDSFVAAFVQSLANGHSLEHALAWGAAAASSACTQPGTELCDLQQTEAFAADLQVEAL